jgi:hypothetical protein
MPMLVVRDWDDRDNCACVPELLATIVPAAAPATLAVRIPVRSIESWLMADADAAKAFFRVSMPMSPDELADPKMELVSRCRQAPPAVARRMVPRAGSTSRFGTEYVAAVVEFAEQHWSPERARLNSPSLDRTIRRMQRLAADGLW